MSLPGFLHYPHGFKSKSVPGVQKERLEPLCDCPARNGARWHRPVPVPEDMASPGAGVGLENIVTNEVLVWPSGNLVLKSVI